MLSPGLFQGCGQTGKEWDSVKLPPKKTPRKAGSSLPDPSCHSTALLGGRDLEEQERAHHLARTAAQPSGTPQREDRGVPSPMPYPGADQPRGSGWTTGASPVWFGPRTQSPYLGSRKEESQLSANRQGWEDGYQGHSGYSMGREERWQGGPGYTALPGLPAKG